MENKEWLESLKPGDKVVVSSNYGASIQLVARTTKTQILLDTGLKFKRDSGYRIGSRMWDSANIEPLTDKIRKELNHQILKVKIGRVNFQTLSADKIKRILAIVSDDENEK